MAVAVAVRDVSEEDCRQAGRCFNNGSIFFRRLLHLSVSCHPWQGRDDLLLVGLCEAERHHACEPAGLRTEEAT